MPYGAFFKYFSEFQQVFFHILVGKNDRPDHRQKRLCIKIRYNRAFARTDFDNSHYFHNFQRFSYRSPADIHHIRQTSLRRELISLFQAAVMDKVYYLFNNILVNFLGLDSFEFHDNSFLSARKIFQTRRDMQLIMLLFVTSKGY